MRLEQLQYIIEIEKTGSISKAAENLYLTQPSVSAGVSALEKELKFKIFKRTKSGMSPTAEGEQVLALARDILAKTQEIYALSSNSRHENFEILTIPAVNSGILGQIFTKWQKKHMNTSLQAREYKVNSVLNEFLQSTEENKRFFCVCSISDDAMKFVAPHLQAQHIKCDFLATDYMGCILCACNAYASRDYISKEEFLSLPRIRYEYMYANTRITKDIFANVAFYEDYNELYQGTLKLEVSTLETLRQLVAEDIGVTVMPSIILNNDTYFRDGLVKILPFCDVKVCLKYYVLYRDYVPLNETEKDFLEIMKKDFAAWDNSAKHLKLKKAMAW